MPELHVVTCAHGPRHGLFLLALLESLRQNAGIPADRIHARVGGIEGPLLDALTARAHVEPWLAFPSAEARGARMGAKVLAWRNLATRHCPPGSLVVFLDADTLVYRACNLGDAFDAHPEADVLMTTREGRWPLNSGVLFARWDRIAMWVMGAWVAHLRAILKDPKRIAAAHAEWGGPDQEALALAVQEARQEVWANAASLPCAIWNAVDNPTAEEDPCIVHYKGLLPYLLGTKELGPGDDRDPVTFALMRERWLSLLPAQGWGWDAVDCAGSEAEALAAIRAYFGGAP